MGIIKRLYIVIIAPICLVILGVITVFNMFFWIFTGRYDLPYRLIDFMKKIIPKEIKEE